MGKASCSSKFNFPDLIGALESNLGRIETLIASTVQSQIGMRFDNEGAYNGHAKWEPLKIRQGQILKLTGKLSQSLGPNGGKPGPDGFVRSSGPVTSFTVEIGSKLIYASVHDNGAIIKPKTKQALRFPLGGGKFAFAKQVTIPKRNFTDLNATDEQEIADDLKSVIEQILKEAKS
jgi:phage gpG-like protein